MYGLGRRMPCRWRKAWWLLHPVKSRDGPRRPSQSRPVFVWQCTSYNYKRSKSQTTGPSQANRLDSRDVCLKSDTASVERVSPAVAWLASAFIQILQAAQAKHDIKHRRSGKISFSNDTRWLACPQTVCDRRNSCSATCPAVAYFCAFEIFESTCPSVEQTTLRDFRKLRRALLLYFFSGELQLQKACFEWMTPTNEEVGLVQSKQAEKIVDKALLSALRKLLVCSGTSSVKTTLLISVYADPGSDIRLGCNFLD